ncbi:hypothetical protein B7R54_13020 [Subtercola boreus]|uniref:DUF86 domain-containing protein n=1 Tax=Subtercola boreus TaxID=120213 RepID=A0A3E0VKQ7_9MICO|nr:HepT-like ribonuclease domain-containing protein [Subtercola boreus]RFA10023.1 hypothetical protein B7R54_13020 [Subtercola boreus]TQL52828.1 uncharacterized protein with HEPN domain [Subtercola boreus]
MRRTDRECLQDALDHLTVLQAHLAESDRDDQMVMDAAALRLSAAIDSVALVSEETRKGAIDGSSWRLIKSMRNRIVHAYGFMDPAVLRATFDDDIGGFERDVRRLLETLRIG